MDANLQHLVHLALRSRDESQISSDSRQVASPRFSFLILLFLTLFAPAIPWIEADEKASADTFHQTIQPLLQRYCQDCHGPEKQKGDLSFERFTSYQEVTQSFDTWKAVLERIQSAEMPPEGSPEIPYGLRQDLLRWLRQLPKPTVDCSELASDRTQNFYRGYVMSRRLTRHEYQNTIRDLTGLHLDLTSMLPSDGSGGEGFDNVGDTLFTSTLSVERYLDTAEYILNELLQDPDSIPAKTGSDLAPALSPWLLMHPHTTQEAMEQAQSALTHFASYAFRRAVQAEEMTGFLSLFQRGWDRGDSFFDSLKLPLKAILVSPHFLFLSEPEPTATGTHPLAPYPLASRLSYFLWASMPDKTLFELAESGELLKEEVLREQVQRMLDDPKADALGDRFAFQWLELESLGDSHRPDPGAFPEWNDEMAEDMKKEIQLFFSYLIRQNRPLTDLIQSDYSFLNQSLASLYQIPGEFTSEFQRVSFPATSPRGGLLGMAGIHANTSYPLRTSPVLRGKWILEVLLGSRVQPPPPNVPPLEEQEAALPNATLRERLEMHRKQPDCAACHARMDPLGFGLENFDVLGRWRTEENQHPIDSSGTLPNGKSFNGPLELKAILLERQDEILNHFVKKLVGYAYGRNLNKFDQCIIDEGLKLLKANHYKPRPLIEAISLSYPFRHRFYAATPSENP